MADCDKVCKYVDLPLQHASAPVLGRMRRPGNRATYDRLLARIRARVPDVALRTTFIVGFPGETEADMDELAAFVTDVGFDHVGVFTYSHEEGTRAHAGIDDVPARTKAARRRRLMAIQQRLVVRRHRARVGTVESIFVDGPAADLPLVASGRLASQAPDIDSVVLLSGCDPSALVPGTFVTARITGAQGYDLIAEPVVPDPHA
jgi:ribosomal protein S12 methylthiotransferase